MSVKSSSSGIFVVVNLFTSDMIEEQNTMINSKQRNKQGQKMKKFVCEKTRALVSNS